MLKFIIPKIKKEEFITGNKFINICEEFYDFGVHFSKIDYWYEEIKIAAKNNKHVFVTHQGDKPVTQEMVNFAPSQIKFWFAANCQATSSKNCMVIKIPLGLNNVNYVINRSSRNGKYSSDFSQFDDYHDNIILARNSKNEIKNNLVYSNFNVKTNYKMRSECKNYFIGQTFVFHETKKLSHLEYLKKCLEFDFVLSPPGNGEDCIRIWESIYLGIFPIVLDLESMKEFEDLPIMFVKRWQDVNEKTLIDFKNKILHLFMNKQINLDKLKINYWRNRIKESALCQSQ